MSAWTPERVATVETMWNKGHTASQIALAINTEARCFVVSRCAVIGKVDRLNLAPRTTPSRPVKPPKFKPAVVRAAMPGGPKLVTSLPPELPPSAPGQRVTIMTLTDTACKFPHGDPKEAGFHFCGAAKREGKTYCDEHCRIAYQAEPKTRKKRSLVPIAYARRESNYGWAA